MKDLKNTLIIATCIFLLSSCNTISYTPQVSLDISPITINKTLQVEKFIDKSPDEDKKTPFLGLSVTNEKAIINELSLGVTNAIITDFSINSLFEKTSRRVSNPDYFLEGEIIEFAGKSSLTTYGMISFCSIVGVYTWFLGMPVQKVETSVKLRVKLYDSDKKIIKIYEANSSNYQRTSVYKNNSMATPSLTNRDFSKVIEEIRLKIIDDINEK